MLKNLSPAIRFIFILILLAPGTIRAEKPVSLASKHYTIHYEKKHEALAGKILAIAEAIWPTLARAYDAYDDYRPIDILLTDNSDDANGNAIYPFSRVVIYAPHINWVMRGRTNWVGNVVTHEIAHIFSLRKAAYLSPVDEVSVQGRTYGQPIDLPFAGQSTDVFLSLSWLPLVAPTWYIEGIAQLEAEQQGYDAWDSQRDMIVRDAYLTGTLPTLGEIETFDGDWISSERVYNTGFAFLRYLRERFGMEKIRALAYPKPIFNFSRSVENALQKSLPDLYLQWQKSLADNYDGFKFHDRDSVVLGEGSFTQSLAFSSDGKYRAWLGNADRIYPINWIFWQEIATGKVVKSGAPTDSSDGSDVGEELEEEQSLQTSSHGNGTSVASRVRGRRGIWRPGQSSLVANPFASSRPGPGAHPEKRLHRHSYRQGNRSQEFGSAGLEFNHDNTRLLTVRNGKSSPFGDIWEYEFRKDKWHRLTWQERAGDAGYHPDGKTIAYVRHAGGTGNLAILDPKGRVRQLTNFQEGQQVYNPRFTPKGDSLYFTLGIGGQEAIVALPVSIPSFDPFAAAKVKGGDSDSSLFPDSSFLAHGYNLTFISSRSPSSQRDLRFKGDTLLWSSNSDGVYNVYAKLPADSSVYRLTQVQSQALEPQAREGRLYYQGYRKQGFQIFSRPLHFAKTSQSLSPFSDSLPLYRPKKADYTKVIGLETGESGGRRVAWSIVPHFSVGVEPLFLEKDTTLTHLSLGMGMYLGELFSGTTSHYLDVNFSKQWDLETPLDYDLLFQGAFKGGPAISHTKFSWVPDFRYSLNHRILHARSDVPLESLLVPTDAGGGLQRVDILRDLDFVYTYDQANVWLNLPYRFALAGRFYRQSVSSRLNENISFTDLNGAGSNSQSFSSQFLQDAPLHRHFSQEASWYWAKERIGTPLPTGIATAFSLEKWWLRFGSDVVAIDSAQLIDRSSKGEVTGQIAYVQDQFYPWDLEATLAGAWSQNHFFTLRGLVQAATFTHKFPMDEEVGFNGVDSLILENPSGLLWPITYKLGWDRMPGYDRSFIYQGRDILNGTALFWTQAALEIPVKLRLFNPHPIGWTSMNQFQFTVMANQGTVVNRTPDQLRRTLRERNFILLADVGMRLSSTFLLYHQLPLTAFIQVFQPINNLKAGDLYNSDYFPIHSDDAKNRQAHIDKVKNPRYSLGLVFGLF